MTASESAAKRGLKSEERQRVRDLEREVREVRRAHEILRKASADRIPPTANSLLLRERLKCHIFTRQTCQVFTRR